MKSMDLLRRGSRVNTSATPRRLSSGMSSAGIVPPTVTTTSSISCSWSSSTIARHEGHVRTGEDRQPDGVGVLLDHRLHDLLGRLVQPGVDDLHARVAQRPGDDLGAPVVAVEAGLGHDDADLLGLGGGGGHGGGCAGGGAGARRIVVLPRRRGPARVRRRASRCSGPNTRCRDSTISPSEAWARAHSSRAGMRLHDGAAGVLAERAEGPLHRLAVAAGCAPPADARAAWSPGRGGRAGWGSGLLTLGDVLVDADDDPPSGVDLGPSRAKAASAISRWG